MRNAFPALLMAALLAAWNASAHAGRGPVALLAPYHSDTSAVTRVPDGYFQPVNLDVEALFGAAPPSRHSLVLPRLGTLAVIHDDTRAMDFNGEVLRWEGHVTGRDDLKVTFVKGLSDMVTGVIDTPAGRVLVGQAGNYIVYKQSRQLPPIAATMDNKASQALLMPAEDPPGAAAGRPAAVAYSMEFNAAAAANLPLDGEISVSLPGAGEFRVVHDNNIVGDLGATTFVGYLKDFGDDFRMAVTYSPAGAQGQIRTPYGLFLIKTIGPRQWLIDVSGSGLRPLAPAGDDGVLRQPAGLDGKGVRQESATASTYPTPARTATSRAISNDAATRIDALVVYTPGLVATYGGNDQARTQIQHLIAVANQAYLDSGVHIQLRLAAAIEVDAPDDASFSGTLDALTNGDVPYDRVAWLRNGYGADLVSLVRPFSGAQDRLCGTAWVLGSNGTALIQYRGFAYSVVGDGYDGGYYCPGQTLAHEISHNLGSTHDRATVTAQQAEPGAFDYSYGYGVAGRFGTIMSYVGPHVDKFSSPTVLCDRVTACGVDASDPANAADNARSLNNTRAEVASFAAEAAGQQVSVTGVVTLQGQGLSGVVIDAAPPAQCSASGANGTYACLVPKDWSGTLTPSLAGYIFTPNSLTLNQVSGSVVNRNFTAAGSSATSAVADAAAPSSAAGGGGAPGPAALAAMLLAAGLNRRQS